MKQELSLSLKQKQVLSLQQRESLLILAMNTQQLLDFMSSEAEENPLVDFCTFEPLGAVSCNRSEGDDDDFLHNIPAPDSTTPEDIVMSQISPALCDTKEKERIFRAVARSVDTNGFLIASPEEIAADAGRPTQEVEAFLSVMKAALEPAGICADSLEECLILQIERSGNRDKTLEKIIRYHLRHFLEGKFACVAKGFGISGEDVSRYLGVIRTLNPKPLNGLLGGVTQYIIPDIILSYEDHNWKAELNDNWLENYKLNDYYVKVYRGTSDPELKEYFRSKMNRIKFISGAIIKRRNTLIAIAEKLAYYQNDFFLRKGPLVPLTMNELSKEIGVHISTISRGIKEKYIQYPYGVSEIRTLFATGIPTGAQSGEISRDEVKCKIKSLVETEDKTKPLSDQRISSTLTACGIPIARRTVAKYREELGISGAHYRKYLK